MSRRAVRPLVELRDLIGVLPGLPLLTSHIVEAYAEGKITKVEAQLLGRHASRSTKGQARELAEARPITDADVERARNRLSELARKMRP